MTSTVSGIHLGPDTHANRPAANTAPDGSFYSCTTHSLIYKSNYAGNSWSTWASLVGTGLADPMTTRGDLIYRNASNTTDRLGVGGGGTQLTSNGTDPSWTAGVLLGYVADTGGSRSITSATLADIPTSSIQVAFTVPASGKVLIILSAVCGPTSTANATHAWGIRESTSIIAGSTGDSIVNRQPASSSENFKGCTWRTIITGLTPAASKTYKWAAANSTSGGTLVATTNSPAIMEIWSVP